ncbi:nitrate- and nitrite sensing domain-containing protein [Micromonospora sp. WMMD975]|uniref:sensor histidine kinase n=1 Tax=Micromonospora sp. WMMD975 TaxID=3016087 RepID=UPI00249A46ED|nr:nitrate- and nitrite sensing domain-containing protein [Micromonospora sp. WMMD975]WFE33663.1 nitrate- and nitrite sensing domain-containing protein [Micromonospora sp. WMMD975]
MSKRPTTAGSFLSRLSRPASRLRDMPIWSKLGLIMIVPTIATVVVGTSGLVDHLETLNSANRAGDLASLIGYSGDLADTMQDERVGSVLFLGARETQTRAQYQEAYNRANQRVDQAKGPYSRQRGEISDLPRNFEVRLNEIDDQLKDLPATRSQVLNGKLKIDEAEKAYERLINDLLSIRDSATQLAGDNDLSDRMRAAAAVARQKEYLAQRRVVVHQALTQNQYSPALREQFIASGTAQAQALATFRSVATPADSEFFDQTVEGPDLRKADNLTGFMSANNSGSMANAPFGPDQWDQAMVGNAKLLRAVESRLDSNVVQRADELRSDTQRQVFLETGLLLTMLLLAILFAYLVARSMARSLRDLRQGALSVAQYGLPQAVARLRDPQVTGQLSPVQLANQIAEPLPVRSKDEFGQVTEAFNAVHLEAVRTAAEQAALRASVATMFVNLARRSQILVDRLIGHLDRLERGEEDPDRLAELFQLDHLATRMRRNDENLLVLAGADSTRVQREPAALIDVLRAAQSEVEHYTRIEFGVIDRDIEVAAHAVNDLVHLVAELFDNATAFSPPDSHVMVEARRVGDRASLYVEDRGIGISADQLHDLNERLATPPQVDVAVSRMMGLVVVARLAARHAVKVELRPAADRGTVADVTLPTTVLVPRALAGRGMPGPALPAAGPQQGGPAPAFGAGPAPAFGALAALGNGPHTPPPSHPGASGNQVTLGGRSFDPGHRNGAGTPANAGAGRAMPAWSDLTGANPSGGDGYPPRSANGQSIDPLPQRRHPGEGDPATGGQQPTIPRQLPSSPEARPYNPPPVSAPPVPPVSAPPLPPVSGTPFPGFSGRPVSAAPVSGHPVSGDPYSGRPVSGDPYSGRPGADDPYSGRPVSAAPVSGNPLPTRPVSAAPTSGQPTGGFPVSAPPAGQLPSRPAPAPHVGAPPVWPPVAPAEPAPAPATPERQSASLDMTTELPRVPRAETQPAAPEAAAPQPTAAAQPAAAPSTPAPAARPAAPQPAGNRQRYADETMELPIFRELESAWFRTRRPGPNDEAPATAPAQAAPANGAPTQQFAKVDTAGRPVPQTSATTGNTPMAQTPTAGGAPRDNRAANGNGRPAYAGGLPTRQPTSPQQPAPQQSSPWQTAADDGWRAASAATEVPVAETTQKGLPKRTPMAQLVPGSIDKPAPTVQRRTPEAVRGLLSAYHRGVQRGRNHPTDSNTTGPEGTPGGQQSSQSGSGPVAGSGQKEQQG